jgi:beta-galactosidase
MCAAMNQYTFRSCLVILVITALTLQGCNRTPGFNAPDRDGLFNADWRFVADSLPGGQAGIPGPEHPAYNDSGWLKVDLPHDWSISRRNGPDMTGPFSKSSPGNTATGYVLGGTGWYRKHFTLDKQDEGKTAVLLFDGVYMEAEVWVNGRKAGSHHYGYTPFWFDITPLLNAVGKENVVAVKVNNIGRNSRWYSGSGIYRNVHLTLTQKVHVAVWGVQVTTPRVSNAAATVNLDITAQNDNTDTADTRVITRIFDAKGMNTARLETTLSIDPKDNVLFRQSFDVENPSLWSVDSPDLYRAEIEIAVNGKTTGSYTQIFGIRLFEVGPVNGLLLNKKPLELKGGCIHHDNGLLGSAAFNRAEERRVEILKANGFNAIRTSHNPPSEAFLNACDRLGMVVIDEAFDMWEQFKNPQDYHRFFREWWKKDLESMILRDRNHPCIAFWSIGNEIPERADTNGIRIAKSLIAFIRELDSTRFFTNAICEFWDHPGVTWEATAPAFELLTVGGYNYQWQRYESDHKKFPERIVMGTESVPMDAWDNWQSVVNDPWVIGDFVWTGMDYLGETGIGHTQYLGPGEKDVSAMTWPWFNGWCGDIDITGGKKPQMAYKDVIWGNSKLEMNVHAPVPEGKTEKVSFWGWPDEYSTWNWKGNEDKPLQVTVYSTGTTVKLELNGRAIGEKEISAATRLKAVFDVPYEPGELKAIAMDKGKEMAVKILKTTGEPAGIKLTADRNPVRADRNDLSYITIEVVDEFGQTVTDAVLPLKLTLSGDGELIGSGNASPWDMESVGNTTIRTYRGKALAIIRPFTKAGEITLTAEGNALQEGIVKVRTSSPTALP